MVLGFKEQFKPLILAGTKIHTIREDSKDRWQPGMQIHMATGVRTKRYECFCDAHKVVSVRRVRMYISNRGCVMVFVNSADLAGAWEQLDRDTISKLAIQDGFGSLDDFELWFYPLVKHSVDEKFEGKIIHWTDYRY